MANKARVDIRWLSEGEKQRIRNVLDGLHSKKGLSLFEISKLVGKSYMKVWGLCKALKIQTRNVAEADVHSAVKRSKHKRTSFDGNDEDKAYILGLTNGDLTALQVSGTAIMVSTSTTHPALASLFHDIFKQYGHVYQYPNYEIVKGYEWKLATRLDNSFQFLLKTPRQAIDWIAKNKPLFMSWLAGILDGDGGINIVNNNSYARISLCFYNTDLDLLRSIGEQLNEFSYHPVGPYLHREKGSVTPGWDVKYTKDMWRLQLERTAESKKLLQEMPLRHLEKVQRKELALQIFGAEKWKTIENGVQSLNSKIRAEVSLFVEQSEKEYLARRAGKSKPASV